MKTGKELYQEHMDRYMKALRFEKPDRTPVIINADSFCAVHKGVKMSDFVSNPELSFQTVFDTVQELGDVEGSVSPANPLCFTALLTKVKLPGKELPDNVMWQIVEEETLRVEDYDAILEKGWQPVMQDVLANRLGLDMAAMGDSMKFMPMATQKAMDAGYIGTSSAFMGNVTEHLSFGRSYPKFIKDLYKMPDKVDAVLDVIEQENLEQLRQQIRTAKENNSMPPVVFGGSARGASEFFTPKLWERFIWRRVKKVAETAIEEGFMISFHVDSDWTRDLEYFTEIPAKMGIFESDGVTSKEKFLKLLEGKMVFKGDVPAGLLALGTPDEVYNYCIKLKSDIGNGLILSSGCTIPMNAKFENVKAMVAAASGK
ncbi:MAG: uroporphyrinogen decarboxylase family protein [Clostridiales bacterium]|jgi:uroporphyrinogen-III decarboxylase|nr:uroporphyrinogen-III decarboxylase [Eubacteriales bacterium]MDH7567690.1 uroporphyrinogen decarboxylase family protein [Clostridiales bacterium]